MEKSFFINKDNHTYFVVQNDLNITKYLYQPTCYENLQGSQIKEFQRQLVKNALRNKHLIKDLEDQKVLSSSHYQFYYPNKFAFCLFVLASCKKIFAYRDNKIGDLKSLIPSLKNCKNYVWSKKLYFGLGLSFLCLLEIQYQKQLDQEILYLIALKNKEILLPGIIVSPNCEDQIQKYLDK